MIKSLLIFLLVLGLFLALFLTRPTKADFEQYVRETTTVVDGKPTGGTTILDTLGEKMRTFSAAGPAKSPADLYLEDCTYENRFVFTNVKRDGKLVYTGAVNHWFERGGS